MFGTSTDNFISRKYEQFKFPPILELKELMGSLRKIKLLLVKNIRESQKHTYKSGEGMIQ